MAAPKTDNIVAVSDKNVSSDQAEEKSLIAWVMITHGSCAASIRFEYLYIERTLNIYASSAENNADDILISDACLIDSKHLSQMGEMRPDVRTALAYVFTHKIERTNITLNRVQTAVDMINATIDNTPMERKEDKRKSLNDIIYKNMAMNLVVFYYLQMFLIRKKDIMPKYDYSPEKYPAEVIKKYISDIIIDMYNDEEIREGAKFLLSNNQVLMPYVKCKKTDIIRHTNMVIDDYIKLIDSNGL